MTVTVDSTVYTADATFPLASGYIPAHIVFAEISEPVGGHVTADTTAYTADASYPTADGGILPGAVDTADADVIAAEVPIYGGGGYRHPIRLEVVEGHGYGVLPPLRGEAHGVVYNVIPLPRLRGEAVGEVGDDLELLTLMILLAA